MEHLRGAFALDQENPPAFAVHLRLNGELKNLLKEATLAKRPVSLRLGQGIDKVRTFIITGCKDEVLVLFSPSLHSPSLYSLQSAVQLVAVRIGWESGI